MSQKRKQSLAAFRPLPQGKNPNRHTQQGLGQLEAAMDRQGYVAPMTAARNGAILDGNARLEKSATKFDGVEPLVVEHDGSRPVIMVRTDIADEDDALARDIIVSANRVAQVDLDLDMDVLKAFMADGLDLAPYEFDAGVLADITGIVEGNTDPDLVPAERATDIKLGDLFELGKHRLLCGDSTRVEDVTRLMGNESAWLMATDPPYGVSVAGGTHDPRDTKNYRSGGKIQNDSLTGEALGSFLSRVMLAVQPRLNAGCAWYLFYAGTETRAFLDAAELLGGMRHVLVWVKPNFVFGRSDYHYRHEPVMYGWTQGAAHRWLGDRKQDSVWECELSADFEKKQHPTAKPVVLFERVISNHTAEGDVIIEPFSGSGAQIIAAERTSRQCRGIEIEPRYVQVAVDRWEAFTGQKAVKVGSA